MRQAPLLGKTNMHEFAYGITTISSLGGQTQNLFSRDGIIPLSLTQDVGGPLARSVEDIAVVLDATAGFDPYDPVTEVSTEHTPSSYTDFLRTGRLKGARFGLMRDALVTTPVDQEVADAILAAAAQLESLGRRRHSRRCRTS